eukprot:7388862-Prymnesium_polylepis.1
MGVRNVSAPNLRTQEALDRSRLSLSRAPSFSSGSEMVVAIKLAPAVQVTALLCVIALGVVVAWLSWSIRKHGWRKRSLRRF